WRRATLAVLGASCARVETRDPSKRIDEYEEGPGEPVAKPLPPVRGGLRERVEGAMRQVWTRELRTDNGFWTVFHAILGMGFETTPADPLTQQTVKPIRTRRTRGQGRC